MVNIPIPTRQFQMVAVDLFECDGKHYLSLQDYYSRYIEVEKLYSTRASFIIVKMKGIMPRNGIPEQVFSDNGPQFSCAEFSQFANTWGFVHSTPSPRYPVKWVGRECRADCEENRNEGNDIGSRPLHRSSGVRGAVSPVVGRTLCTPAARVRFPG